MKNLFLLFVVLGFFSCAKNENIKPSPEQGNNEPALKSNFVDLYSKSVADLHKLINEADYSIGIICDANLGMIDLNEQSSSFKANGVFPSNFNVVIDEERLLPTQEDGGMLIYDTDYSALLGKVVTVQAGVANAPLESKTVYFPRPIVAPRLIGNDPATLYIEKASQNVLTWTPDPNNNLGMVVKYELFDREDYYSDSAVTLGSELALTEDDGSYDIGPLINIDRVKAIKISLIRANALQYVTPDQDVVMIGALLADHHFYMVR